MLRKRLRDCTKEHNVERRKSSTGEREGRDTCVLPIGIPGVKKKGRSTAKKNEERVPEEGTKREKEMDDREVSRVKRWTLRKVLG